MPESKATRNVSVLLVSAALASPLATASAAGAPPPLAQKLCQSCHGEYGIALMPGAANLSGQQHEYIREQLRAYRSGRRASPHMNTVAKSLTDEDIDQLADFYSSIRITVETPQ